MARTKTIKDTPKITPAKDFPSKKEVHGCIRFSAACLASLMINMEERTIFGTIHDDLAGKSYTLTGTITEEE